MPGPCRAITAFLLTFCIIGSVPAREWSDSTGKYTLEADLVGFDDEVVILQRENKELGSCPIDKLSKEDQEFLKSKEATEIHDSNLKKMQTWTTAKGLKVIGRIVDYDKREVKLQRRRGRTYVNDTVYENLPDIYQTMLLSVVEHFEGKPVESKEALVNWIRGLRGQAKTYQLEGVILELENGDEYAVPFFLFSEKDQGVLKPGWEQWVGEKDPQKSDDHAFRLQSLAASYHHDQQVNQQIAMMNLNMQAIQSGLTSAWEVSLYPVNGNPSPPRWVVTLGRNSLIATEVALRENPGFYAGPVRRVSR